MTNQNIYIPALLSIILMVSCSSPEEETTDGNDVRTVNVKTEIVSPDTFESFLRQVGTVVTAEDIQISAQIGGRITNTYASDGDYVNEGDTIVKIDDRRLRQELRRLEAVTEQSRENYERLQRLFEQDEIGSEMEVLNARYTFEQNQASLESVKIDLENTSVQAPFSGTVEDIMMDIGETVAAGSPVIRMISAGGKKIRLGVPAHYAERIHVGDDVEFWFDFDEDTRYKLPITYIGNSIDPQNRTFRVEIALPADFKDVKVEMLANVRLRTQYIDNVIIVNAEHVFRKRGNTVAYVVGENDEGDSMAEERILEMGPNYGNLAVVEDGLRMGEEIITLGSSYLQDGTRIEKVGSASSEFTHN